MATKNEMDQVMDAVEAAAEKVEKAAKPAAAKAEKAVKEAAEKVEKAAKPAAEKAEKAVKEAAADVKAKAAEVADKAAAKAEKTAEKVEKAVKETADKAGKAVKEGAKKVEKAAGKKAKADKTEAKAFTGTPRLKEKYQKEVIPALKEKFGYKNPMEVPKLEKIILNMGLGAEKENPKGVEAAAAELALIAGQKPVITKAKKSVANFKVREGMNVGAKVTLRGDRMYYFADKFMNIVLPRVRDFRGVSDKSFDGRGNYATGVKEQLIFPEINYDDMDKVRGMNIVFVTSAKTDEEAKALLTLLGMPFVQA